MIPTQVRIFVCTERQDMRRSFDALGQTVRERLQLDPDSGALFVLRASTATGSKCCGSITTANAPLQASASRALQAARATDVKRPLATIDARTLAIILRGVAKGAP